jgi:hypothetical protein
MNIPKEQILDLLRQRGQHDQAAQADGALPDMVNPETDGGLLSRFGLDPMELLSMFGGGGLGGALGGALGGGGGLAALAGTLGKLGVGGDKVGAIVPLVLQFLQARLGGDVAGRLHASVPFLKDLGGGGLGGALGGLGKMLGR